MEESDPKRPTQNSRGLPSKLLGLICTGVAEPFFMMFAFSFSVRQVSFQEIVEVKVCKYDLEYSEDICQNITGGSNKTIQDEVQRVTNNIIMAHALITIAPSILIVSLLSSFCDKYGRKMPVIVASLGMLSEILGTMFCLRFMDSSAYWLLFTAILSGMSGGFMASVTLCMSYLAESTSAEDRSLRYALMEMSFLVSSPMGGAFGGYVRKEWGFMPVFVSSFIVQVFAIVWIIFRLKEPGKKKMNNWREVLSAFLSFENLKENFRASIKKRPNKVRAQIWLLYLNIIVNMLCIMGISNGIGYLFVQKMYNWDNYQYSLATTFLSIGQGLILLIAVPILNQVFKIHDSLLVIIGAVSNAAKLVLWSFSYKPWLYYTACGIGIFLGCISVGTKSRLSKIVEQQDIARVFSALAMWEGIAPMVGNIVWTEIYNHSLDWFPGLTYLCAGCMMIIPIAVSLWILSVCRNPPDYAKLQELPEVVSKDPEETEKD